MKSPSAEALTRPGGRPSPVPAPVPGPAPGPVTQPGPKATVPPTITGVNPPHAVVGTFIEIDGQAFQNVQHVFIGGVDTGFKNDSATVIHATVPNLQPGQVQIQVQTQLDNGSIATSAGFSFTVDAAVFTATFSPATGRPGDVVTLRGTGISRLRQVVFNSAPPVQPSNVSEASATVIVPDGATTGPLLAVIDTGTVNLGTFTVLPATPQFDEPDEFDPKSGIAGDAVVIHGKHLASVTQVLFHMIEVPASQLQLGANQRIGAVVPAGATTGPIALKGPNGSVSSQQSFVVIQKPQLDSADPPSGRTGMKITLNGRHLGEVTSVDFNGTQASFKDKTERSMKVTVPNVSPGTYAITVRNRAGQASIGFTVTG